MGAILLTQKFCKLNRFSRVQLFATLWTVWHQALLSMGFSKQEHSSGFAFPSPGILPDPVIEPASIVSCIGKKVLYRQCHLGNQSEILAIYSLPKYLWLKEFIRLLSLVAPAPNRISFFVQNWELGHMNYGTSITGTLCSYGRILNKMENIFPSYF